MLPKAKRLTARDFKGARPKIAYRGTFFDVSTAPGRDITKFACVVAKKRIKRSVDRNTARRKVYALLRSVETKSPLLVFIYPTKAILEAPYPLLEKDIKEAFATL